MEQSVTLIVEFKKNKNDSQLQSSHTVAYKYSRGFTELEFNCQGLCSKSKSVAATMRWSVRRRLQATLISGTCHDQCSLMHVQTRDVFHQLNMTLMAPVVAEVEAI